MRETSLSSGFSYFMVTDLLLYYQDDTICRIIIIKMGFASLIFDQLKIANSCYMAAAIEFNYALFHIFSGPLFANLQGYAFLDLMIWGVSPLLFEACRIPLRTYIQPIIKENSAGLNRMIISRRFGWFMICFLAIAVSYLFMNYSPSFRWNYFSRIVNLDFGYLLFDLACRCMEFVVEIEEEEQIRSLINEQSNNLEPILHSGGYCKYRNIFMMAAYFLIFYLSTVLDPNDFKSGIDIFRSLSILCCLFTLSIPFLYIFRHRHQRYGLVSQIEESQNDFDSNSHDEPNHKANIIFCLVSFSYFVNISYFSLWIMEGFKKQKDDQHQQFNKTLLISSAFFLIGSFIQFVVANTYIGCKIKEGMFNEVVSLSTFIRPFLIGYGLLILVMFVASHNMEWQYMVIPILFFGFHNIIMAHLTEHIAEEKAQSKAAVGYHKLNFYCETFAYLILPILLTILGQGDSAIYIYGFLSGGALIIAGVYL